MTNYKHIAGEENAIITKWQLSTGEIIEVEDLYECYVARYGNQQAIGRTIWLAVDGLVERL